MSTSADVMCGVQRPDNSDIRYIRSHNICPGDYALTFPALQKGETMIRVC